MHTSSSVAEETASYGRKMLTTPRQAKRTQRTVRVEKNRPVEVKHHSSPTVLTVGHSTRPLAEFIALLSGHSVSRLVDVRTVPRSRHNPQFNRDSLPAALEDARIRYTHAAGLGGFRHTHPGSLHMGWRNDSFRGFADYMQTPEFARHLGALIEEATHDRIALLCAQAVPWRCHRSLIADALPVHGIRTEEIINATRLQVHKLTSFARVNGVVISTVGSAPEPKAQDRTKPQVRSRVKPHASTLIARQRSR